MGKAFAAAAIAAFVVSIPAQGAEPRNDLGFLVGDWEGSGSGEPGRGAGRFSFAPELDGRVLVRHAHSEYPAAGGRPATVHDDLLVVHSHATRAVYFDNEGHVIHYAITTDAKAGSATFLSDDPPPSPLFRLVYKRHSADELGVTFEISPSGKASDFKTYLDGVVRRR